MPPAGHALWVEVGGGITFVTSGENARQLIKLPNIFCEAKGSFMRGKPYMLALAGQPNLHGYYACMVYWNKEALRRNCRQEYGETSFFSFQGFSV